MLLQLLTLTHLFHQSTRKKINIGAGIVPSLCFTCFTLSTIYVSLHSHASATHHWLAEGFRSGAVKRIKCPVSGSDVAWWRTLHETSDPHSRTRTCNRNNTCAEIILSSWNMYKYLYMIYIYICVYIFVLLCRSKASSYSGIQCIFRDSLQFYRTQCAVGRKVLRKYIGI